jgi:hypothetical protein
MTEINSAAPAPGSAAKPLDMHAGRRAFVRSLGLGVAGAALLGGVPGVVTRAKAQVVDDAAILNFALNLEYLEAEFYLHAAYGRGLRPDDIDGHHGPAGQVIGGHSVNFESGKLRRFAKELADEEEKHVIFLRQALGGAKVARPEIDLRSSFTKAARAANLIGPDERFDAFANDRNFLLAAFIFEDVGVTAYKGAVPLIVNQDYLAAAAGILGTEAYHAGMIRTLCYNAELYGQTDNISDTRDALDGGGQKDERIGGPRVAKISNVDDHTAICFDRTPREVLNIVYLGTDHNKGGFFPNGLNGTIRR